MDVVDLARASPLLATAAARTGRPLHEGEAGIVDPSLAARRAPSAGLRHRLVHEYDRLEDALVLASVGGALGLYPPRYLVAVERFLESGRDR